jgi:DNA (cytosine-5)-methyltransferase 1
MSWLYSQVLVEEYLAANSLDGEQSVQSSGSHIQQAYCAPDKMIGFSRLSRFGMTFKPLMEHHGEALLMSYLAAFHAKTLVRQEKAQELMENDQECGEKWRASFVKFDHDSSSWKTHQCSLLGDLDEFSETWPQWGLMRDGECWEQRMLEQTIRGTESGLSPNGVDSFHTPNTTGLDGGSNSRKALRKKMEKLPTPQSTDHRDKPTSKSWKAKGGMNYSLANPEIQAKWPTPTAHNSKETNAPSEYTRDTPSLTATVMLRKWGTPKVQDSRHALRDRGKGNLGEQVSGLHNGGKLNPTWTEWLMGWPLEWTDLKPLEMDKCHFVPQQHGES